MAGKTGTSQVRIITMAERARGVTKNEQLPWNRRDHALFVCFAPYDQPRYAVAQIVEHGGGGSAVAAPSPATSCSTRSAAACRRSRPTPPTSARRSRNSAPLLPAAAATLPARDRA